MLVYMEGMSYVTSLVSGSKCKDSISVILGVSHLCIVFESVVQGSDQHIYIYNDQLALLGMSIGR